MSKWIMNLIGSTGYFGIVLLMFVEKVFSADSFRIYYAACRIYGNKR